MKCNFRVHGFASTAKQQKLVKNSQSISNFISDNRCVKGVEVEVIKVDIFCKRVNIKLPDNECQVWIYLSQVRGLWYD